MKAHFKQLAVSAVILGFLLLGVQGFAAERIDSVSSTLVAPGDSITITLSGLKTDGTEYKIKIGKKLNNANEDNFTDVFKADSGGTKTITATVGSMPFGLNDQGAFKGIELYKKDGTFLTSKATYMKPKMVKPNEAKHYKFGGDAVPVAGAGFKPNVNLTVNWTGGVGDGQVVTPNAYGYFEITIPVPKNKHWESGISVWVVTTGDYEGYSNQKFSSPASVVIDPIIEIKELDDSDVLADTPHTFNDQIKVNGFNFYYGKDSNNNTISDEVKIYFSDTLVKTLGRDAIAADGSFTTTISIPVVSAGGYFNIKAVGDKSNTAATDGPVLYSSTIVLPDLILSKTSGQIDDIVTLTGVGASANQDVGFVQCNGTAESDRLAIDSVLVGSQDVDGSIKANVDGVFKVNVKIRLANGNYLPEGAKEIFLSDARNDYSKTFTINPKLISAPQIAFDVNTFKYVLSNVDVTGFRSEEKLNLALNGISAESQLQVGKDANAGFLADGSVKFNHLPRSDKLTLTITGASSGKSVKYEYINTAALGRQVKFTPSEPGYDYDANGKDPNDYVKINDQLKVQLNGWTAGKTVVIKFGDNPGDLAGGLVVGSDGYAEKTFNVPYVTQNTGTIKVWENKDDHAADAESAIYNVKSRSADEPIAGLSAYSGFVGDMVTVHGFDAVGDFGKLMFDSYVIPYYDMADNLIYNDANNNGKYDAGEEKSVTALPVKFKVPTLAGGSNHQVRLKSSAVGFTIKGKAAITGDSPKKAGDNIVMGDKVKVSVSGFSGSVNVYLYYSDDKQVLAKENQAVDANGTKTFEFTIPSTSRGTIDLKFVGTAGGGSYTIDCNMNVVPKITISPTSGLNGTQVEVKGYGYTAGKTATVKLAGNVLKGDVGIDGNGYFAYTFNVSDQTAGVKAVDGVDNESGQQATANFTVRGSIKEVGPLSGAPGTKVTVKVEGYSTVQGNVKVKLLEKATDVAEPTLNFTSTDTAKGQYTFEFNVPNTQYGPTLFQVFDNEASNIFTFGVTSKTWLSAGAATVGTEVTVNGAGFVKGNADIYFEGVKVATAEVDDKGVIIKNNKFKIPNAPKGDRTVQVTQADTSAQSKITVNSQVTQGAPGDPVNVGATVTIKATGFEANKDIKIKLGDKFVASGKSGADGTLTVSFTVPAKPDGNYPVEIWTSDEKTKLADAGVLNIDPKLVAYDPDTGSAISSGRGDAWLDIKGTGFAGSQIGELTYQGTKIADVETDGNGSFQKSILMPNGLLAGKGVLQAVVGGSTAKVDPFTYSGTAAKLELSDAARQPYSKVKVYGSGYAANSSVGQIKIGGVVVSDTITTDKHGTFVKEVVVPTLPSDSAQKVELSGAGGSVNLTIQPVLSVSPGSGYVGDEVVLTGYGFKKGKALTNNKVTFNGVEQAITDVLIGSKVTDNNGNWIGTKTDNNGSIQVKTKIPDTPQSKPNFTMNVEGQVVNVAFEVLPKITALTSSVTNGGNVNLKATGLPAWAATVNYGGAVANIAPVNGKIDVNLPVNNEPYGNKTVKFNGGAVKTSLAADAPELTGSFLVNPKIITGPADTRVEVGAAPKKFKVFVSATGFTNDKDITFSIGGKSFTLKSNAATGTVFGSAELEGIPGGTLTITGSGPNGESASALVTVTPRLEVSTSDNKYYVGKQVTAAGYGFIPGETVSVYNGGTLVSNQVANSSGQFTATFTVPTKFGQQIVKAVGQLIAQTQYTIAERITSVTPLTGKNGSQVRIIGDGADKNAAYRFSLPGSPDPIAISDNGTFDVTFNLGPDAPGKKAVKLQKAGVDVFTYGQSFLYSDPVNAAFMIAEPDPIGIGETLTVRGYNFDANTNVGYLTVGDNRQYNISNAGAGQIVSSQIITDDNGAFAVSFGFPSVIGANQVIGLTGNPTTVNVGVKPTITVSPGTATDGAWVRIVGSAFAVNANIGNVFFDGTVVGKDDIAADGIGSIENDNQVKTDASGQFAVKIKVPYKPEKPTNVNDGKYNITVGAATTKLRITGHAKITEVTSNMNVGDNVTIKVQGFPANVPLKIQIAGKDHGTVNSDGDGRAVINVILGAVPGGSQTVKVWTEADNTDKQSATKTTSIDPEITSVNPLKKSKGERVDVTGTGFGSGDQLSVVLGSKDLGVVGSAKSNGTFLISFSVPSDLPYGAYDLTVKGSSGLTDTYPVKFSVDRKVEVTKNSNGNYEGTYLDPGSVLVRGWGFKQGEEVTVKFGTHKAEQKFTIDSTGQFTAQFSLSDEPNGNKTITVTGSVTEGYPGLPVFKVYPVIKATPTSGLGGTVVTVEGWGFDPGVTAYKNTVSITIEGKPEPLLDNIVVDSNGYFAPVNITIPTTLPPGDRNITAYQSGFTGIAQPAPVKFTINPGAGTLSVNPTSGTNGTVVKVSAPAGTFHANKAAKIYLDGDQVLRDQAIATDGNGALPEQQFTVGALGPVSGGQKVVRVVANDIIRETFFQVNPRIKEVSPNAAAIDDIITVVGDGLAPGDTVQVLFGEDFGDNTVFAPVAIYQGDTANADGTFTTQFRVPDRSYSKNNFNTKVKVVGSPSGLQSAVVAGPQIQVMSSRITLDPDKGNVDTVVKMYGTIIEAGVPAANVDIGEVKMTNATGSTALDLAGNPTWVKKGTVVGNNLKTDANAAFELEFKLADAVGNGMALIGGWPLTFSFTKVANLTADFDLKATVVVDKTQAKIGDEIMVSGSGYLPETEFAVKLGDLEIATGTSGSDGRIASFAADVPKGTLGGDRLVKISQKFGPLTIETAEPATLTILGQIAADPKATIAGGTMMVTGNGFGAAEGLEFKVGDQVLGADQVVNGATDANGEFTATITLPDDLAVGTYDLTVTGATSGIAATTPIDVIEATATATPAEAEVGDTITVTGVGLPANTAVEFYLGDTKVEPAAAVTTDENGAFTAEITIDKVYDEGTKLTVKAGALSIDAGFAYKSLIKSVAVALEGDKDGVAIVDTKITVTVTLNRSAASGVFSIGEAIKDVALAKVADSDPETWTGTATVETGVMVTDAVVTAKMTDAAGKVSTADAPDKVTIDAATVITAASTDPTTVKNGDTLKIMATAEPGATVTANLGGLDSTAGEEPIPLKESTETPGAFEATVKIADANTAANGTYTVTIKSVDKYGNEATAEVKVELKNAVEYTLKVTPGISLVQIPVALETPMMISTFADAITNVTSVIRLVEGKFVASVKAGESWLKDDELKGGEVLLIVRPNDAALASLKVTGKALDGMVVVKKGLNLIGSPVKDPTVATVGDLIDKLGGVTATIASQNGTLVSSPAKVRAMPITGGMGLLVVASADSSVTLTGEGWDDSLEAPAASPFIGAPLASDSAPVLIVNGQVQSDEGAVLRNITVTVQNTSTAKSVQTVVDTSGLYVAALVDLGGEAVKVGDRVVIDAIDPTGAYVAEPIEKVISDEDILRGSLIIADLVMRAAPTQTVLLNNYPNPFNPETWIPFNLAEESDVTIRIFDSTGRIIRSIKLGHLRSGYYTDRDRAVYWDGRNDNGEQVASGIYFYQIQAGSFTQVKRMVLLK